MLPIPGINDREPVDEVLKPSYEVPNGQKQDSDIDGK